MDTIRENSRKFIELANANRNYNSASNISPCASWCNTIKLNSDPIYLDDSFRSHKLRAQSYKTAPFTTSGTNCKFRLLTMLLTDWLSMGGSMTPFMDSINLPKRLTTFIKTFYLLYYQFPIRGIQATRWKRCIGQGQRRYHGVSMLFKHTTLLESPCGSFLNPIL